MREIVFLLEEQSAKEMLASLTPRVLGDQVVTRFIPFEGKNDLQRQLVRKLRGYKNPFARFIVLQDQDRHPDCTVVKKMLMDKCAEAGKLDVTTVRIACRELESFYLADLKAVELALNVPSLENQQSKSKYRAPDLLSSPAKELEFLTRGRYQKVGGSREIGKFLSIDNSRSLSFRALVGAIRRYETELLSVICD